jgi:hypothetical protein
MLCLASANYYLWCTQKKRVFRRKVIHMDSGCPTSGRILGAKVELKYEQERQREYEDNAAGQ